jgi:hypothetical protein
MDDNLSENPFINGRNSTSAKSDENIPCNNIGTKSGLKS